MQRSGARIPFIVQPSLSYYIILEAKAWRKFCSNQEKRERNRRQRDWSGFYNFASRSIAFHVIPADDRSNTYPPLIPDGFNHFREYPPVPSQCSFYSGTNHYAPARALPPPLFTSNASSAYLMHLTAFQEHYQCRRSV